MYAVTFERLPGYCHLDMLYALGKMRERERERNRRKEGEINQS